MNQANTPTLHYLGPEGTFTHQAALQAQTVLQEALSEPMGLEVHDQADQVIAAVQAGQGLGVVALDNNVEGYVIPNLDALIDAENVAGFALLSLDISFDAFVRPDHGPLRQVCAHPHALAQCRQFIDALGLSPHPTTSNAAACRDLTPSQLGLGPSICSELYHLQTFQHSVDDYQGGHTQFVLLSGRDQCLELSQLYGRQLLAGDEQAQLSYETLLAMIPLKTGPGVLAALLDQVYEAGLNMTSFMSRPIKGHDGTYSFIARLDAAPSDRPLRQLLAELNRRGVWLKTLAVCPSLGAQYPPVDQWMLPSGGVLGDSRPGAMDRELLWGRS